MNVYRAIGEVSGCRALATAFYARVERDPILRPLFPSTFKCAIEEFSAFLVQFLGGEADATQKRWWLSLQESHDRFAIGPRERDAWLRAMTETLHDDALIPDAAVRNELLQFFRHSSARVVNRGRVSPSPRALRGELAQRWNEQRALDEAMALMREPDKAEACLALLESALLQGRFQRSPAVHASVLAEAARSGSPLLREHVFNQLRSHPALARERYKHWRTMLHDASGDADVALVERLLEIGVPRSSCNERAPSPLYCLANECSAPEASRIVHALLRNEPESLNAPWGVKRCTPLHMAARRGNADVIQALLDEGAEIEFRDSAGETPLRRAVNCNKVEAARLLLARGANPDSEDSKGLSVSRAARSTQMKQLFAPPSSISV